MLENTILENVWRLDMVDRFESIWRMYPCRVGKKLAVKYFRSSVKTEEDWENINNALTNYIKSDRVKRGFIQNGQTWFNNWRDWVDYTDVKVVDEKEEALKKFGIRRT